MLALTIIAVLVLLFLIRISAAATDAITQGQLLTSSQTIVSSNGIFELGFFSFPVEGSTTPDKHNFYLGVWYKRSLNQTIVWVANRDNPISSNNRTNNSSCFLTINNDGNLGISSGEKGGVSLPLTSISPAKNHTCAMLLDTGNFVLRDNCSSNSSNDTNNLLWQSFDYPSDTFLPGMKIGFNSKTGKIWQLTAWRSPQDPSPGPYTLVLDREMTSQLLIMNGSQTHWTTGPWNGKIFSYIPELDNVTYTFNYVSNANESYFLITALSDSILSRIVMDVSGKLQQHVWLESGRKWVLFWEQPKQVCDVYKYCGALSDCDRSRFPYCQCLQGFQPSSQKDWSMGNWSSGCARRTPLQCGDQDGFILMNNMSFPLEPKSLQIQSADACKLYCLQICNCNAYAFKDNQCSIWFGSLYNVRKAEFTGGDLLLRLAASEVKILEDSGKKTSPSSNHSGNKRSLSLVLALPISMLVLILSSIIYCLWRRKMKRRGKMDINRDLLSFDFNSKTKPTTSELSNISKIVSGETWGVELPFFSFLSVSAATNNFSDANKLGQGGFGPVYKGTLLNGYEVAIKRLSSGSCQGLEEFKNETTVIAKLQHRNLVRLLGCCIEGEEKILIYEYMPNNSLDAILFDPYSKVTLTWERRINIVEGIAQGLLYLHQYSRLRIIHRDLKASNILLDGEMSPRISDFGMARIFGGNRTQANTHRIVGTYGYMSPEYAMEGFFSIKSDVFSFGVLLLEILSGKKNSSFYLLQDNHHNLIGYAWNLWVSGRVLELIDPMLGDSSRLSSSPIRYIHVALLCVQEKAIDRPTMSEVIAFINSESTSLPTLKQPAFSFGNSIEESSSSSGQACSINNVTLSLHAR